MRHEICSDGLPVTDPISQPASGPTPAETGQANTLEDFLISVERRALHIARYAIGNQDDALDAIQEAMFAFVRHYAEKPANEWKALFYRVLQNKITDIHRKRGRHDRLFTRLITRGLGGLGFGPDSGARDIADSPAHSPADSLPDPLANTADENHISALRLREGDEFTADLEQALKALPNRQRETFLLRIWEGLDVAETATALDISAGSVKTHLSRALQSLRNALQHHNPSLLNETPNEVRSNEDD